MTAAWRRLAALALVAAAAAAGCSEVNTAADHVAALQFDSLPSPAVVSGDSLRDSVGRAAPLRAIAINGAGTPVVDAAIPHHNPISPPRSAWIGFWLPPSRQPTTSSNSCLAQAT